MMPGPLRVLVVDDSAYVRKVVREMLSRSPFIEVVGTAHNGSEAIEQVERLKPDVVTSDILMPELDGVEFVRAQMARRPVPIVIVSTVKGSERAVLDALSAGAVDFVHKPSGLATERLSEIAGELIDKVKAAAAAPVARLQSLVPSAPATAIPARGSGRVDLVVMGVSAGGPQALRLLIPRIPSTCRAPIAIVLHMPAGYTEYYARNLDDISELTVREAADGDALLPGLALIARGGLHLSVSRSTDEHAVVRLVREPRRTPHRPAVDVLFRSAAEAFGERVLGVVMTGMGTDGREGAAWIKSRGGTILTQAEETCVVYGMPRAVVEAGLSDAAVPLDGLAAAILERL